VLGAGPGGADIPERYSDLFSVYVACLFGTLAGLTGASVGKTTYMAKVTQISPKYMGLIDRLEFAFVGLCCRVLFL